MSGSPRQGKTCAMPLPGFLLLLFAFSFCLAPSVLCSDERVFTAGPRDEETIRLGEIMYRQGLLPSGDAMKASVEGDIPIEGSMFACESCHLRSGIGSLEGTVITLPTNGRTLYLPLSAGQAIPDAEKKKLPSILRMADRRPAYTDETLARAIRYGIDPAGRLLDDAMPRYQLDERDMGILVHYLKNLSSDFSPGVTATTLRFATIMTDGVSKKDREAMAAPLEAYIRDRNNKAPYFGSRAKRGPFAEEMDLSYRLLILDRWELKGPPETWRGQLDAYYNREPVFAVLGGIARGDWTPIHRFCEDKRIPCVLPVTDFPHVSRTDWYTLYFSKGLYQEAETVARYLRSDARIADDIPVVQVFRNTREGTTLSMAFQETRKVIGERPAELVMLDSGAEATEEFWNELANRYPKAVLILWLDRKDLLTIGTLAQHPRRPTMVFASATLLDEQMGVIAETVRSFTFLTYPQRLPGERERNLRIVETWLKVKKIPVTNLEISSQMYFLGVLLTDTLMEMKRNFYRDHFLEVIDMMSDQTSSVAVYPRLSFGPGQRYASKGCYVVQLSQGANPEIVRRSEWVVH